MQALLEFAAGGFAASAFCPAYIGPGAGLTLAGSFLAILGAGVLLLLTLLSWPVRILWLLIRPGRRFRKGVSQVVVVGLDGLDPRRTDRLIAEGRLPNLAMLARTGTAARLGTTLPPISPVAWSSFQTGVNPGKHAIFDFLNRDLRTCLPQMSSVRMPQATGQWRTWLGFGGHGIRMLRKSQPFWKVLGQNGVFSSILRVPISFPPEPFFGLSLSAMCTPDLRGSQGSYTLFTTDSGETAHSGSGIVVPVTLQGDFAQASLPGPDLSTGRKSREGVNSRELTLPLTLRIDRSAGTVTIRMAANGGEPETIVLKDGESSGWVTVRFRIGWWRYVWGLCRFHLCSLSPHVRLYVTPIQLHPDRPAMPISHPAYFSTYLARLHGAYATLGLAEDTGALVAGVISEATFLEHAYAIHAEREAMLLESLRVAPRGLTVCVFDGPDRIQHMFYRHDDPAHPANRERDTATHANTLDRMYERMDELVGKVARQLHKDGVLFVMSDHGFCAFRRGIDLNRWLLQAGYLALREDGAEAGYLRGIDWSRTRAYAFGLSGIYLNLQGREARGIVPRESAEELKVELADRLEQLHDPETNAKAIRKVHIGSQAYHGPYSGDGPDLVIGYEEGYRVAWNCAAGECGPDLFQDNTRLWSGDHCVDPELVPGVLFSNRRFTSRPWSILDLAPTILRLFDVPLPAYFDGSAAELAEPTASVPVAAELPQMTPQPAAASDR
jgi:predicted AlkP superfamily phosphohydrolase/phosphomutase